MSHRHLLFDVALQQKFRRNEEHKYLLIERNQLRQGNGICVCVFIYIYIYIYIYVLGGLICI